MLHGWADGSFVPQSHYTAIRNCRYPKRTHLQQEKSLYLENRQGNDWCAGFPRSVLGSTFGIDSAKSLTLVVPFTGASTALNYWFASFGSKAFLCVNCRDHARLTATTTAKLPGQFVCWGVTVTYLTGMADYHCLPCPAQILPYVQVSLSSNKLLVRNWQRLVWRSLYL